MSKPIQLEIPSPCSQPWQDMTPIGQGRLCAHCQKTVIDFTTTPDADLHKFFTSNKATVCGRFYATQLHRIIHIPPQPHSHLYYLTIALGFTLLFTHAGTVQAQPRAPLTAQAPPAPHIPIVGTDTLYGTIVDVQKEPVIRALVRMYQDDKLAGACYTDFDGNYSIVLPTASSYQLHIHHAAHSKTIMRNVTLRPHGATNINVRLTPHSYGQDQIFEYNTYINPTIKSNTVTEVKHIFTGEVRDIFDTNLVPYNFQRGHRSNAHQDSLLQKNIDR